MHFERIYIQENFRRSPGDDPFLYGNIGVSVFLNAGDTMEEAEHAGKEYIKDYISRNTQYPEHQHIEIRTIPDIQVGVSLEECDVVLDGINQCETIDELYKWNIISKKYPVAGLAFSSKAAQLLSPKL